MRKLLALIRKECLLLVRDRHGLLVLFLMPAIFILIMSLALRDAFDPQRLPALPVAVLDQDDTLLSENFRSVLSEQDILRVAEAIPADEAALRHTVHRGDALIGIVILPGFAELLTSRYEFAAEMMAGEPQLPLLRVYLSPVLIPQLRQAATMAIRTPVQILQSRYLAEEIMQFDREDIDRMIYVSDPRHITLDVSQTAGQGDTETVPSSVQQSVPAWLVFAMFFVVIPLATTFIVERQQGSLMRLHVFHVPATTLFLSKLLPYYLVNMLQMALMFLVGMYAVPLIGGEGLQLRGSPVGLLLIASATSLAALGLALMVAIFARTTIQATTIGGVINIILGAIGGIMVPKLVMPPAMQSATMLSPMSWGLEGFWDMLLRDAHWTAVLPEAAALTGFGMLCLLLGVWRYHRAPA